MQIDNVFELGEKVELIDHKIKGVINSIWLNRSIKPSIQYELEWKDNNGLLNYRYFSAEELKKRKEDNVKEEQ